ncbi:hypothetical protein A3D03_04140 [Candidatus Gottesmanbacteria bacterium RIFCSPHIGHO2_02_FULL_40_13]|uniref:ATP-grasp domain-containing protein n=1 Tax=Candidatus Gottesmanbacteria bacterium RIFCSPHIGHO2_02_FULL_40_13 TaxID=1798384 RepID=A0A1F6A7X0_9BACT|nr:MAG: hypothetical protein A3D03_04140 [Candidatus Gottesmanbacteria bacterium RIFCSPHIGHO2_02_FULL_40_13]
MNSKKSTAVIYISNMSEDVWPFISAMSSSYERESEIQENARLSEHDLYNFFGCDDCLIILPMPPDPHFYQYFRSLSKNQNFTVMPTKIHTGEISKDILNDIEIMDEIERFASNYSKVKLISYTASEQFIKLSSYIQNKYKNIVLAESPSEADSWVVDFYGSKSGIRQLSQQFKADEPDFKMAGGLITVGIVNSAKIAANMYIKNGGIVLKTNKGHSGAGIIIYKPGDLSRNYNDCEKSILQSLDGEKYWQEFPIILEKYIEPNNHIGWAYPNIEFKIHQKGRIEMLYYCTCRITDKGVFKGIEIHENVLPDKISAQLIDTGYFIGEKYAEEGYRGYFDVDFITAKNNHLFVTESNIRRTGGTHVYYLAKALYGDNFMHDIYSLSNNLYNLKTINSIKSENLFTILEPVMFSSRKMEGCIITGTSLLAQKAYGYVIFGRTALRARKIEVEMETLLTRFG